MTSNWQSQDSNANQSDHKAMLSPLEHYMPCGKNVNEMSSLEKALPHAVPPTSIR